MEERTPHVITLQDVERAVEEVMASNPQPLNFYTRLCAATAQLDSMSKNVYYSPWMNPDDMIIWESGPIKDIGPVTSCARLIQEYRDEYERLKVNSMDVMSLVYKALKDSENEKAMESTTKNKLRLIVTDQCHNNCPLCCNRQFNMDEVPVVSRWDYDEICITGGEPISVNKKFHQLVELIDGIRAVWKGMGHSGKIYIYTSTRRADLLFKVLPHVDGIVYTIHNAHESYTLQHFIYRCNRYTKDPKSFRLNYFKGEEKFLPSDPVVARHLRTHWKMKQLEWIPDCPVPEGEEFRRIKKFL